VDAATDGQRHPDAQVVRLADFLELTHAELVHANPTSDNLDHRVTDVLVQDPLDDWVDVEDRIILALGVSAGAPDFDQLLQRAADRNAAAVVVKAHGASVEHVRAAGVLHGVAVLVAPDSADWSRLATVARASVMGAAADSVSGARLGDLFALANSIASITNAAASIVDPRGRIVGYSTLPGQEIDELRRVTTLALEESVPPAFDEDFKVVYSSPRAVHIPLDEGGSDRLALAVRAGGELLGSVWLIDPGEERRAAALEALDRIGPLIGLHMLHARSASDFGERRTGDLMRTLMEDPAHASFAAAQLGLDPRGGLAVAAFALVGPESGRLDLARQTHRLLDLVTTVCNVYVTHSATALIEATVYAVLTGSGEGARATHRRILREVESHSHTISSFRLVAAVGRTAASVDGVPESRDEALSTLTYLWHRAPSPSGAGVAAGAGTGSVALFEDHRIPLNLLKIHEFIAHHALGEGDAVSVITAHDATHGTDYLQTVRAYSSTNGNISAMADLLHVHKNTVRYRLARLVEEFHLDLEDPYVRLWLALRVMSTELADTVDGVS
jgi:hypothetical protein